jgi:hypothetical protein
MSANLEIIRAEWRLRTLAQYRSASITAEFLSWLVRLGFSSETLVAGNKMLGDKLDHADMAYEGWGRPTFERMSLAALDVFSVAATLAAPLHSAMLDGTRKPEPKQMLDRVVTDAASHKAFGWAVIDEALEQDADLVRKLAKHALPKQLARWERAWGLIPDGWIEPVGPHEKPYGLIPRAQYKREFYQSVAEEVLPALDDRNLGGRGAWGARPR